MIYSLDRITKHYPAAGGLTRSLDDLSLGVHPGERLALIGRSGAGKTTLFRLLNGMLRPTSGTLHFDGRNVGAMSGRELRAMRRRIGMVYQQHHLVPSLSALDNTLCGRLGYWSVWRTLRAALKPSRAETEWAMHALEAVGLADKRAARADELSGGQQQRLAIARALMQDPEVILADEPVASLDPGLAESIATLLVKVADESRPRRTLIVTLHTVELALRHFPRVVGVNAGRIAFDVPVAEVSRDALDILYAGSEAQTKEGQPLHAEPWREPQCAR